MSTRGALALAMTPAILLALNVTLAQTVEDTTPPSSPTIIEVTGRVEFVESEDSDEENDDNDAEVQFALGYAISRITEPVFGTGPDGKIAQGVSTGKYSTSTVEAIMHLAYHDNPTEDSLKKNNPFKRGRAISFGVGKTDNGNKHYTLGHSWNVANDGYLTIGYSWARVPTLSPGYKLGDLAPRGSTLPLGEKVVGGVFVSVSYIVLAPDEGLIKWQQL